MRYVDLGPSETIKRQNNKRRLPVVLGVLIILAVILFAFGGLFISSLFTSANVFSKIIGSKGLDKEDGITSILVFGTDKRSSESDDSAELTDTIMVVSIDENNKKVFVISLPRDLWVKTGATYGKINAAYSSGGIELAKETVSNVLGIPIHYWGVLDFEGFRKGVDLLGGIDIYVDRQFDDYRYPKEGYENVWPESERWELIHFDQGVQHMDGETALKFARSRHALGPEGTDFARSKRQQKVLVAIKEKALSLSTLVNPGKIKGLFDTFKEHVETNIGVWEAQRLYEIGKGISSENIITKVVDRGSNGEAGFLYTPQDKEPYGGAWVVVPKAGDFSEIHAYIQKLLFGE